MVTLNINYTETNLLSTIIYSPKKLLIPINDLESFYVKSKYLEKHTTILNNIKYIDIKAISNIIYELDLPTLNLSIAFPSEAMEEQFLAGKYIRPDMEDHKSTKSQGVFLNYDLVLTRSNINALSTVQDLNYFTPNSTLTHSYFFRADSTKSKKDTGFIRMETYLVGDVDKNLVRWRVGDSTAKSSNNGLGGVKFAGVQYGTYFAIDPNFTSYPLSDYIGVANSPTSIEVFSNSVSIYKGEVNTGEFKINDLPITGIGDLTIKTTDISGKISTFNVPYYIDTSVLAKDIVEYSFSTGMQRSEYSVESYKYQSYIGSIDYKKGMNDFWTLGGHGDLRWMPNTGTFVGVGVTNIFNLSQYGKALASIAQTAPKTKDAYNVLLNYNNSWKNFNFSTNVGFTAKNFSPPFTYVNIPTRLSSLLQQHKQARTSFQTNVGYRHNKFGDLNCNFSVFFSGGETTKTISANYNKNITKNSFLRMSIGKTLNQAKSSFITLSYGLNLDKYNLNTSSTKSAEGFDNNLSIAMPMKGNEGWGARASANKSPTSTRYDVQLDKNFSQVETSVFLFDQDKSKQTQQLNFRGSVIGMDKDIFFSKPFYGSVAVINAGGYPDITVYKNNNPVGKTNKKGKFVMTDITPYVPSLITLDDKDLPFSANFTDVDSDIIIRERGGEVLDFSVKKVRALTMNIKRKDGKWGEINEELSIQGVEERGYIGYDGLAYISDIGIIDNIVGTSCNEDNNCCSFDIKIPATADDYLIDLGEVRCE